jgi:hypothetical protein
MQDVKLPYVTPTIRRLDAGGVNPFHRGHNNACPQIDGVSVTSLGLEFGSPLFVFSEAALRAMAKRLPGRSTLPVFLPMEPRFLPVASTTRALPSSPAGCPASIAGGSRPKSADRGRKPSGRACAAAAGDFARGPLHG